MRLAGRDAELAELRAALTRCLAGQGGVVLIGGAPASGRTALLEALRAMAAEAGALVLAAGGARRERAEPLGVAGQLLAAAPPGTAWPPGGATAAAELPGAPREFRRVLLELAAGTPVVLLVDDAQHSDLPSLECLAHTARRVRSAPVLLVLTETTRLSPEYLALRAELAGLPHCGQLRLDLLSAEEVATLPAAATPAAARACHAITGGNPLLVRALLRERPARTGAPEPGEDFRAAVATCLHRCDPAELACAQALAVLGPDVHAPQRADIHAVLGELLGLDLPSVGQAIGTLERMGLLEDHLFRHEAARTAVLETMRPADRAARHGHAARVLHHRGAGALVVARHLEAGQDTDCAWAVRVLAEAAEQAVRCGDGEQAVGFLRRARQHCAEEAEQARLTAELARVEWRFAPTRARHHLPELLGHARAGLLSRADEAGLCRHLAWHGQLAEVLAVLADAEARTGQGGAAEAVSSDARLVRLWLGAIFPELSPRTGPAPPAQAGAAGLPAGALGPGWASDMLAGVLSGDQDVLTKSEQVLHEVLLRNEAELASSVSAVVALVYASKLEQAAAWCESLIKESAYPKAPAWQALLTALQALVQARQGRMAQAHESAEEAVNLVPPPGWGVFLAMPLATLLLAATTMGRYQEAARHLRVPVPDMVFRSVFGLQYLRARGTYYLATRRHHAALADFQTCGRLMTGWDLDLPTVVPWRTDAAQALIGLGKLDLARDLVYEQLLRCPAGGSPRGVSLRVLAITREAGERLPLLRESTGTLEGEGDRYELTLTVAELARAHRELGEHEAAGEFAARARRLAADCGVAVPEAAG